MKIKSIKYLYLSLIGFLLCSCNLFNPTSEISDESIIESVSEINSESASDSISESTSTHKQTYKDYYDGYYSDIVSWSDGEDLKNQLSTLLHKNFTSINYDNPNWETNSYADQAIDDFESLDVVYSYDNILKTNTNKGWQREHAFCASLMTGFTTSEVVSADKGRAVDFHNLFASSASANSSRGNKMYGIANPDAVDELGNKSYQDKTIGNDGYKCDNKVFEPANMDKGRLSRAIFYMATMYKDPETSTIRISTGTSSVSKEVTYPGLSIVEEVPTYSKASYDKYMNGTEDNYVLLRETYGASLDGFINYSIANCSYSFSNLSLLLSWNNEFSVDRKEMQHNIQVFSHAYEGKVQGNRNPYVDFPELVDYVYGDKQNEPGKLNEIKPSAYELSLSSKGIANYAIKEAKRDYYRGDFFTHDDYSLYAVNYDFSFEEVTLDDYPEDYQFTTTGPVEQKIFTPLNTIVYKINVSSGLMSSCNYYHEFVKDDFASFAFDKTFNPVKCDTYTWLIKCEEGNYKAKASGSDIGVTFGGGTANRPPVKTLTIRSYNDYMYKDTSKINAIYLKADTAANKTYDIKMKINDTILYEGTFSHKANEDIPILGTSFTELNGVIEIEISNITAAVTIYAIAVNSIL